MSADPKCSTCAYRVNELRRRESPYCAEAIMVCLHPKIGRQDCRDVRLRADGACGDGASLWALHATAQPQPDLFAAQAAAKGEA